MALEKRWSAIAPISFTADGTTQGLISLNTTRGLKVKQIVALQSSAEPKRQVQIQKVLSSTQIIVSELKGKITDFTDVSEYLLSDNSFLFAEEQPRPVIPITEHERAVYEEEPTVAKRVFLVDEFGNPYLVDNPFPVQLTDGNINIETLNAQLEVHLSHTGAQPDSVQIGDGTHILDINPDGSINVVSDASSAQTPTIENISVPLANTEVSFALPNGTRRFSFKVRDGNSKARLAFEVGESGTNFITVEMGQRYLEESVKLDSGLTLYFQCVKPNQTVEILYWT